MKNIVCFKEVPDPQDISVQNGTILFEKPEMIMNPFDEYAVEEAVCLHERFGCQAISLTLGPSPSLKAVKTALALGVEKAIEIHTDHELDSHATGVVLAQVIKRLIDEEQIGLIIVGRQTIDQAKGQVGCVIAELLHLPFVSNVVEIVELTDRETRVKRRDESGVQLLRAPLPCVVQVSGGEINEPRTPTLKGLLRAKKTAPQIIRLTENEEKAVPSDSTRGSITAIHAELPPERKKGVLFQGPPEKQVNELIKHLQAILHS